MKKDINKLVIPVILDEERFRKNNEEIMAAFKPVTKKDFEKTLEEIMHSDNQDIIVIDTI